MRLSSTRRLPSLLGHLFTVTLALSLIPPLGRAKSISRLEIPEELQASDQDVKTLIDSSGDHMDSGDLDGALLDAQKAWDLCQSKKLDSDLPFAGLQLASALILKGDFDSGREILNKALERTIERANPALAGQILISVSALKDASGNRKGALEA